MRASRRPKNSSTKRRTTWVESTRSAGAWKLPTLSAREWRSATDEALGANGSWTWTKSSGAAVSASSIVRAMSSGGDGIAPRRPWAIGSSSPTPSTRTPPAGSNSSAGASRAARISRRDSRTSSGERDGASTSTRCPARACSCASPATNALTSCSSSQGYGDTWAIAKRSATAQPELRPWTNGLDRRFKALACPGARPETIALTEPGHPTRAPPLPERVPTCRSLPPRGGR